MDIGLYSDAILPTTSDCIALICCSGDYPGKILSNYMFLMINAIYLFVCLSVFTFLDTFCQWNIVLVFNKISQHTPCTHHNILDAGELYSANSAISQHSRWDHCGGISGHVLSLNQMCASPSKLQVFDKHGHQLLHSAQKEQKWKWPN